MNRIFIFVSVILFAVNAIGTRWVQTKYPESKKILRTYQILFCLIAALLFWYRSGFSITLNRALLLYGMGFGLFFFTATLLGAVCYEIGSMSVTSIITNLSFLIPIVYGCIASGDQISGMQCLGIGLIVVVLILVGIPQKGSGGNRVHISPVWFPAVLIAFFSNGMTAVLQKRYITDYTDEHLSVMMTVAYLTSAALFLVCLFVKGNTQTMKVNKRALIEVIVVSIISGIGSFGGNLLVGILCNVVEGAILYSCVNGGLCLFISVVSFLAFKEKCYLTKILALVVGVSAIIILNVF